MWLGAIATALACSFDAGSSGASVGLGGGTTMDGPTSVSETKPTDDGPDSATADSAQPTTAGEESSGPPPDACGGGGVCVPAAPEGWSGPVVLGTWTPDMTALECPQDWMTTATGGNELEAPMASCGCACTPIEGECLLSYTYYGDASCQTAAFGGTVGSTCTGVLNVGRSAVIATTAVQGSSCTPVPTANVPPPAWAENALACQPPAPLGECDDGPCLPAPPFGDYCVSAPGDQSCPAGPFVKRRLVYRDFSDTRACTPCECGHSAACTGSLREHETALCGLTAGTVPADGTCRGSNIGGNTTFGVAYQGSPPQVTCAASSSVPTGSASAGDPITFCCT